MKNKLISSVLSLVSLVFCLVLIFRLFAINITVIIMILTILLIYSSLLALSWKSSTKAHHLQTHPFSHKGGGGDILKIALAISSPFYFCILILSCIPLTHYAIWCLIIFPAILLFAMPLTVVADFCKDFKIRKTTFWAIQIMIQLTCVGIGRFISVFLMKNIS